VPDPAKAERLKSPVQHIDRIIQYSVSRQSRRVRTFVFRIRLNLFGSRATSKHQRLNDVTSSRSPRTRVAGIDPAI
jgi:hypothetical protein